MKRLFMFVSLFSWYYCVYQRYDGFWTWKAREETTTRTTLVAAGRVFWTEWGAMGNYRKYMDYVDSPFHMAVEECEKD